MRHKYDFLTGMAAVVAAMIMSTSCSDDTFDRSPSTDMRHLMLTLRVPGFSAASRSVDENSLSDLSIHYFRGDDELTSQTVIGGDIHAETASDGNTVYKVTLEVPDGANKLKVTANATDYDGWIMDDDPNGRDLLVMYGETDLESLEVTPGIRLMRSCAKTVVSVEADDFEVLGVNFYGAPDCGLIPCGISDYSLNIPDEVEYATTPVELTYSNELKATAPYYHYEATNKDEEHCYIIIHGSYCGVEGYYKASYIEYDPDPDKNAKPNRLDIYRNHSYLFDIKGINDYGWPTEREAREAEPDNRMTVMLYDYDESIYDMIACRDYYLGVGINDTVSSLDTQAELKLITSYTGDPQYTIQIPEGSWINGYEVVSSKTVKSDYQTEATEYTLRFAIDKNDKSSEPRETTVTVNSGDLSRTVTIVQKGYDFMRDPERTVLIWNLKEPGTSTPYFDFLTDELRGETAEEMTAERGDGLHFSVYNNDYYYTIPKLSGDRVEIISQHDKINITDSGDSWRVTCVDNSDYQLWTGAFKLTNGDMEIVYKVYHHGIFHNLCTQYQQTDPDGELHSGWYYYEQVDVTGSDGEVYHVLDRNLGASDNHFFSPSGAYVTSPGEMRGAYYRIADFKDDKGIRACIPDGFDIPLAYHWQNVGVNAYRDSRGTVSLPTLSEELPSVYLPATGYIEGVVMKNDNHVCLWSQSLLSGNQGFSTESPEYGYWYLYLDVYAGKVVTSNLRFINKSAEGIEPLYKSMPIRCIKGPVPPDNSELPIMEGRRRIYCLNSANWSQVNVHCFSDNSVDYTEYPGPVMSRNTEGILYIDIPQAAKYIVFSENKASKTGDITVIQVDEYTYDNVDPYYAADTPIREGCRRIYCKNSLGWPQINVHYFTITPSTIAFTTWPGEKMLKDSQGRYYLDIDEKAEGLVLSNNGASQTPDLTVTRTLESTYDNQSPYYVDD